MPHEENTPEFAAADVQLRQVMDDMQSQWLRWYLDACAIAGGKAPDDIQPFLPWNMTEEQRRTLAEPMPAQELEEPLDTS